MGALNFDIKQLCDYYINRKIAGRYFKGNVQVYFAIVHTLGELPDSEIELMDFSDSLPDNLTYLMLRDYFPMTLKKKQ